MTTWSVFSFFHLTFILFQFVSFDFLLLTFCCLTFYIRLLGVLTFCLFDFWPIRLSAICLIFLTSCLLTFCHGIVSDAWWLLCTNRDYTDFSVPASESTALGHGAKSCPCDMPLIRRICSKVDQVLALSAAGASWHSVGPVTDRTLSSFCYLLARSWSTSRG